MDLQVLSAAVVVLADRHNPTILHPAFLESQKITVAGWELASPPICTPPIAVVKYQNGITFITELEKFQVLDEGIGDNVADSTAPELARRYITALPHVRYTAVGLNFNVISASDDAERVLIDKFLKPGPWYTEEEHPAAAAVRLVYNVEGASLRLGFDPGESQREGEAEKTSGIIVNCNFHTAVKSLDDAKATIDRFPDRHREFMRRLDAILGEER